MAINLEYKTRFILKRDPERYAIFEYMVENISKSINVKPKVVRECGMKAFKTWEEDESLNFTSFYSMKREYKESEVSLVLDNFRENLQTLLLPEEKIEKSMKIALDAMKFMFLTPKGSYWL